MLAVANTKLLPFYTKGVKGAKNTPVMLSFKHMTKTRKSTILITSSTYPRWKNDSVPSFVQQFSERMSRFYDRVYVLAPHYKGAKRQESEGRVQVKRFRYAYPAGAQNIVYDGGGTFKIKKTPAYALKLFGFMVSELWNTFYLAVAKKVVIINAHWIIPQGFLAVLAGLLMRKKVVISVHGTDIFGLKGRVMTVFKRFTLKHADHVVANSTASLEACREVYPRLKGSVIPMGTDLDFFKPKKPSQKLIDRYDLKNTFTILFIGRLTEVKGTIYLMEALRTLKQDGVLFKALIAGEGPDRQELEAYVEEHELTHMVHFLGWVSRDEILDFYSVGDVLVGPSLHEAFGLVFVEAQASGVPVIASRVNGIPDIVSDGKTGLLVESRSSDDIAKKLQYLYENPKLLQQMKQSGPKAMSAEFSWESVEKRYETVFSQLS